MSRLRWIAPEVVQTSAMDCGPASLKCLLDGFGIPVSYGRLREACQTDVDGTSIDTLEDVAGQLGLEAEQVMMPVDHVLLPEAGALPALAVVRLPSGVTHFLVLWRLFGGRVQVMDPGTGRRWPGARSLRAELYEHQIAVPAADWREWAGTEGFLAPLGRRLHGLGHPSAHARALLDRALGDEGWLGLAALDAATRMVAAVVRSGGLPRGREASRLHERLVEVAATEETGAVPDAFWSVRPSRSEQEEPHLDMRGAVLVRVLGQKAAAGAASGQEEPDEAQRPLSPELAAALREPPTRPLRQLLGLVRAEGALPPLALAVALCLAAGATVFEALLFRGLLDLPQALGPPYQRLWAAGALLLFLLLMLLLELPMAATALRLGRHLESRLRIAFLEKIPRLGDRYFHSRLTSDMAERGHAVPAVRAVSGLGATLVRSVSALAFTTLGIAWLDPAGAPLALVVAAVSIAVPLGLQRLLSERDLRVRTHGGALTRFYLDALLGLVAIRAHGAERSVRREHEGLLAEWARASLSLLRASVGVQGLLSLTGMALAGTLLLGHLARGGDSAVVLLLAYWALKLPALGSDVASVALAYPAVRNVCLRLFEPLGAPEEEGAEADEDEPARAEAVAVELREVSVNAGGHPILEDVSLRLAPAEHVAIVGSSGAGKSSLVGLLLGFHTPTGGEVLVDGRPLRGAAIDGLRRRTAWVDPAVQLWNRTLLDNLAYGAPEGEELPFGRVVEAARIRGMLEALPSGLQTRLGEGGGLVSGGEGQRVRLGRALLRRPVGLAVLDEAFRGLDRGQRRGLLAEARAWWKEATLLCVTHDVEETKGFDRILVVEGGRIVEDGPPAELAARAGSRYGELLSTEREVREGLWSGPGWRRLRLAGGALREAAPPAGEEGP